MEVKCPKCGKMVEYNGNESRPFCSARCKLIDFGAWANEEFALPTQDTALTEEDLEQIEKVLNEKSKL
ncbi:MAG: DNA gyrase inhibitor YacG [Pyrinomonadaceae bacterium]|nr:DNA gyrase inhibitor YacG [Pyrinomonadaceae bacterium]